MQPVLANATVDAAINGKKSPALGPLPSTGVGLRIEGRIARLGLVEGARGNLLTLATVTALRELLVALGSERLIELVVIEGEAGVFCSGPDLAALYHARTDGADAARDFARGASALVAEIARHPRPVLALMDGVVIGGGLGLGAHATYRVVTQRTRIALPQTAMGLVPDLGLSRLLARAPAGAGAYLCLTGVSIGAADAIKAGFADGFIHSDRIESLCEKLANRFAGPIEDILNAHAADPGDGAAWLAAGGIETAFSHSSVAAIVSALDGLSEPWAEPAKAAILGGSAVAMQLALALIRQAAESQRLEDCLRAEHHFVCKLFDCGEAYEGIGSRLVETGRLPRWLAARPEDVDPALLAPFLTPLRRGDGLHAHQALDS
jgi:enoyl-CoA hydratase